MSLSTRLSIVHKNQSNVGCRTCRWLETLEEKDRKAFQEWVDNGWSVRQLYEICATDPENPLRVSNTALRNHIKDCSLVSLRSHQ